MTRIVSTYGLTVALLSAFLTVSPSAHAASSGEQAVAAAAKNNQFAFVMFYRGNDAAAQAMHGTIKSTLTERRDAVIVPVTAGRAFPWRPEHSTGRIVALGRGCRNSSCRHCENGPSAPP